MEAGEPIIEGSTYVSLLAEVFGDMYIGERSFVAGNTVLRAHPGERLTIGSETNAQDNIILRSFNTSTYVADRTSLAHHAVIRDSEIGNFAFVGFLAEVIDSEVGEGALVSAHALVEGEDTRGRPDLSGPGDNDSEASRRLADRLGGRGGVQARGTRR